MPTYEYACDACGHDFEREQRMSDDPIKKCPKCGKMKARRMIGAASFILKGGGWYADGYSGSGKQAASSGASSEPAAACATCPAAKKD